MKNRTTFFTLSTYSTNRTFIIENIPSDETFIPEMVNELYEQKVYTRNINFFFFFTNIIGCKIVQEYKWYYMAVFKSVPIFKT